jgi:hypothetical protein
MSNNLPPSSISSSTTTTTTLLNNPGPAYELQRVDHKSAKTATEASRAAGIGGYQYQMTAGGAALTTAAELESLDYSSHADSESYLALHMAEAESSITGHYHTTNHFDATELIHEMHLALLYLLSNPDEFEKALLRHPARGATTLAEWNAEYDTESLTEADSVAMMAAETALSPSSNSNANATPLPFVVFADDAEVVLPQAHTASQLFGLERIEGIELEAAAGITAISKLFLRWLGRSTFAA